MRAASCAGPSVVTPVLGGLAEMIKDPFVSALPSA